MDQRHEPPALADETSERPDKIMIRFRELLEAEGLTLTEDWDKVFTAFCGAASEFPVARDED